MATSIRIDGLDTIIVELRELAPEISRRVVLDMSQIAYDTMQEGAGRHGKTRALFQSVYNRALGPASRQVGHDEERAPHAKFVLYGTRPHEIRPKDKSALRWVGGNGFIFARVVNHPGTMSDNYLDKAADDAVRQMPAIVDRAIKGS